MSYRIALNFQDGTTRIIDCGKGETVLAAATRSKINLPMDCLNGVCGTCKCHCEHGLYELGNDYLEDALTDSESERGYVLTCQMVPTSDCLVTVPVPSSACRAAALEHQCTITEVVSLAENTIALTMQVNDQQPLDFLPGQYVNLRIPGTRESRAFSFSSRPGTSHASFLIRNVPEGRMSRWLIENASSGMAMSFTGPQGVFFLRPVERPVLFLAGGTGLAPFLSMLEVLAEGTTAHRIHLVYGVAKDSDRVETARLTAFTKRIPTFTWSATVSDPETEWPLKGYVSDHLSPEDLNAGEVDMYLCGPPAMVESVRTFLDAKGISPRNFYYEKFVPSDASGAANDGIKASRRPNAFEWARRLLFQR
jgi:benzoate/toluate 1,2-dioxygenase reductase subunit